jgi:hypothetical protein
LPRRHNAAAHFGLHDVTFDPVYVSNPRPQMVHVRFSGLLTRRTGCLTRSGGVAASGGGS